MHACAVCTAPQMITFHFHQPSLRHRFARCIAANENILRILGTSEGAWNMCMNLHWMGCAINGRLPGQLGRKMHFSIPPGALDLQVFDHPSSCVNGACDQLNYAGACTQHTLNSSNLSKLHAPKLRAPNLHAPKLPDELHPPCDLAPPPQ